MRVGHELAARGRQAREVDAERAAVRAIGGRRVGVPADRSLVEEHAELHRGELAVGIPLAARRVHAARDVTAATGGGREGEREREREERGRAHGPPSHHPERGAASGFVGAKYVSFAGTETSARSG